MDTTKELWIGSAHAGGAADLVKLDPDHPGFRDAAYRDRRNAIARLALDYRPGEAVPDAPYSDEEHAVWRTVQSALEPLHDSLACREYLETRDAVALPRERIPQLAEVNTVISSRTGFSMLPVAGLVGARTFLRYLARDIFLATQYIRHHSRPMYTPEPDVVHELIGHAVTFGHPAFAELSRTFGAAAAQAATTGDAERIEQLERLYWYTLEFGVLDEDGALKAYGAGFLSSAGELGRLQPDARGPRLAPFDVERIVRTPYDPTDYQDQVFVARSLDGMARDVTAWCQATTG